jgi:hypothetical protein
MLGEESKRAKQIRTTATQSVHFPVCIPQKIRDSAISGVHDKNMAQDTITDAELNRFMN